MQKQFTLPRLIFHQQQRRPGIIGTKKFGHISQKSLEKLAKNRMVEGFTINQLTMPSIICEACIQAKQSQKPYPKKAKNRSKTPGERIMLDVWGPTRIELIGKWKWYILFIDDCTQKT